MSGGGTRGGDRMMIGGRLVLDDRLEPGRVHVEAGRIVAVEPDPAEAGGPIVAPGLVDVHVHGWGGHDAMGDAAALDGMARALLRRGVTSFLPTGVTSPMPRLAEFADRVRGWIPASPGDGAEPLGFNLEGPFISPGRKGAHDPAWIVAPADVPAAEVEPLLDGLRLITIAPEIPGALGLIELLRGRGVPVSIGHSAATLDEARAGYAAGGRGTTHLFNAMTGVVHRAPGLAVAALIDDEVFVELIADGRHVHPALWRIVARTKPADRLVLVSDAVLLAGTDVRRATIGGLEVEIDGDSCRIVGSDTLAGSVIALDTAVRNLVAEGIELPAAVAAASRNPLALLRQTDRGRIAVGLRPDLVVLDDALRVLRVTRGDGWIDGAG